MKRENLIKKLRKLAKVRGCTFLLEKNKGKGSHYRIVFDGVVSTLQHDLSPGRIERFLKQLEIKASDL